VEIPPEIPTIPEFLRLSGWSTFGVGKWHNGKASHARSFSGGGAIFFGGMSDHLRVPVFDFDPSGRYPDAARRAGGAFSSTLFADEAVRFLRTEKGPGPFFLYVAFTAPHDPRTPPEPQASLYDPTRMPLPANFLPEHPFDNGEMKVRDEELAPRPRDPETVRRHLAAYYGMVSHMDSEIGRILDALRETGRDKDTLVVFASDQGLAIGSHGLLGKQNLYDHSVRTPLVFCGPGVPRGGQSDALCYLFDVFPTLCDLTGMKAPATVEGQSLAPILSGKAAKARDLVFGAYRDVQRMVRTDRWKLIRYPKVGRAQLFDLKEDPEETRDLSADPACAARIAELDALLRKEQKKLGDPLLSSGRTE